MRLSVRPGRRRMGRVLVLALAAALLATPVAAYGEESPSPSPSASAEAPVDIKTGPRTLIVGVTQAVDTLNPFRTIRAISFEAMRVVYSPLMLFSAKDSSPVPGLAESWDESADKLTWTFHMRKGATFSDGKPVTAKDAAFTYNLILTNDDAKRAYGNLVAPMESVTATDDYTLVIKVKQPSPVMLTLEAPIVPEHIFAAHANDIADFKNDQYPMVGSGPFQVTEFKTDQFIRFKANKNYWDKDHTPKYDELVFRYFKNTDAAVLALGNGEIDIVGDMTPAQFKSLQGKPGITLNKAENRRYVSITFNPGAATKTGQKFGDGHPALTDVRVRQALHYAIDKQTLVAKALDGLGTPGEGYIPPALPAFHWKPDAATEVKFDIAKANSMLDAAGYKRGPDGLRTMPDGTKPFKFRFITHSTAPTESVVADHIKGWWKELGIELEVHNVSADQLTKEVYTGAFDIAVSSWGVSDPDSILGLHICSNLPPDTSGEGQDTDTFYCNADYDKLYAEQKVETDEAKRKAIIDDIQKHIYVNAPVIVLYNAYALEAYRSDRFTGFIQQPEGRGTILRQMGMWGLVSATPVTAAPASESSNNTVLIVVLVVVALIVIALVVLFVRRRQTADERE